MTFTTSEQLSLAGGLAIAMVMTGCHDGRLYTTGGIPAGDGGAYDAAACSPAGLTLDGGATFDVGPPLDPPPIPPLPDAPVDLGQLYCAPEPSGNRQGRLAPGGMGPVVAVNGFVGGALHAIDRHDGMVWQRVYEGAGYTNPDDVFFVPPSRFLETASYGCGLLEVGPGSDERCLGGSVDDTSGHVDPEGQGIWLTSGRQLFTWNGAFLEHLAEFPPHSFWPDALPSVRDDLGGDAVITIQDQVHLFRCGHFEDLTVSRPFANPIVDLCTRGDQIWVIKVDGQLWSWIGGDWVWRWTLPSTNIRGIACGSAGVVVGSSEAAYASWRGWAPVADFDGYGSYIRVLDVESFGDDGAAVLVESTELARPGCGGIRVLISDTSGVHWL